MSYLQNCTSLKDATSKLDNCLTNDCMFHVIFQKNQKVLRGLCASLLHMYPEEIRSTEVLNPFEFKTMPTDKTFILDLKVMQNDNRILNSEVQVVDEKDWPERSLTYACRTFDQLKKGESYLDIKPVRQIGFLDYDTIGNRPVKGPTGGYAKVKFTFPKNSVAIPQSYRDAVSLSFFILISSIHTLSLNPSPANPLHTLDHNI